MIKVFGSQVLWEAHLLKEELALEGIEAELRGEVRPALAGGIPIDEAQVELWVVEDKAEGARKIIAASRASGARKESLICPKCRELNPSTFEECWSCKESLEGAQRGGQEPASGEEQRRLFSASPLVLILMAMMGFTIVALGLKLWQATMDPCAEAPLTL
jgi:hypothetical protein